MGFAHRDIKLGNILICDDTDFPGVKVTDFDIARLVSKKDCQFYSSDAGTWYYMAPEIMQQNKINC